MAKTVMVLKLSVAALVDRDQTGPPTGWAGCNRVHNRIQTDISLLIFSGWESVDTGSGTEMVGCGAGFTGLWTDLAGSYRVPDRLLTEIVG